MMNFLGVLSDVLNYVLKHTKDGTASLKRKKISKAERIDVYVQCLKLLKALAHENAVVQKRWVA